MRGCESETIPKKARQQCLSNVYYPRNPSSSGHSTWTMSSIYVPPYDICCLPIFMPMSNQNPKSKIHSNEFPFPLLFLLRQGRWRWRGRQRQQFSSNGGLILKEIQMDEIKTIVLRIYEQTTDYIRRYTGMK